MNALLRRGACPGLSVPMQTGDGLLVRMVPRGTISLDAFAVMCEAAREHGNGVVEISARGSIQVRGLSPTSAPRFAAAVAPLGIGADGIAIHASPLAGLTGDEVLDVQKLAADLRRAVAERGLAEKLAPKISIVTDGGGALSLDGLSADVRLRAELSGGRTALAVSVGGNRLSSKHLGFVAPADGVAAVICVLEVIAQRGRDVRARDIVASESSAPFKAALGDVLLPSDESSCPALCRASTSFEVTKDVDGRDKPGHDWAIGTHQLRDGSLACGVGLAFGHADATSLVSLTEAAAAGGANGVRAAPDRALIYIGFSSESLRMFAADAERLGFIVRANDPRRFVVACAGAPICASAHIAARALAPSIATACGGSLGDRFTIHVSGCAKGCAQPGPAAVTVIGTAEGCALVGNGSVRDAPVAMVTADELPVALVRRASALIVEARHV